MAGRSVLHRQDLQRARAALAGDTAAFDEIFDYAFPRLYRFALLQTRDEDRAEDLVQATLCTALSSLPTYRGEAALLTWMTSILRHQLNNRRRAVDRRREVAMTPDRDAWLESLPSQLDSVAGRLERDELAARVHQVLDWLPAGHAQLLTWKYFEELGVEEIARRLGVGLKAAESRLGRARNAFRREFATLAGDALAEQLAL